MMQWTLGFLVVLSLSTSASAAFAHEPVTAGAPARARANPTPAEQADVFRRSLEGASRGLLRQLREARGVHDAKRAACIDGFLHQALAARRQAEVVFVPDAPEDPRVPQVLAALSVLLRRAADSADGGAACSRYAAPAAETTVVTMTVDPAIPRVILSD